MAIYKDRSEVLTTAISRLLVRQPFFAVLLFDLMRMYEVDDEHVMGGMLLTTAGTNGRDLFVNRTWFATLTPAQRTFLLAHEVMHVVLNHIHRAKQYHLTGVGPDLKPFNPRKANIAMDIIINDWLLSEKVGDMPPGGFSPNHPEIMPFGQFSMADIWDEVYVKLQPPEDGQSGGKGQPSGGDDGQNDGMPDGGFDKHDFNGPPSNADGTSALPSEQEVRAAVAGAAESAKAQGKSNALISRLVGELVEAQVDWRAQLRAEVTSKAGRDDYTWARPNRKRLALAPNTYMPGRTSEQAGVIAAYFDTSGSIGDKELSAFLSEMVSITDDCNPEEFWIGDCAHEASIPELVEDNSQVESYKPKNGGGTYMPAIFKQLNDHGVVPDICVILTDGYTPFDEHPGYEVIWVMTTDVVAPYGKTLRIKV